MDLAEMEGFPLLRIPKKCSATGKATGKGRLIANLSYEYEGGSINTATIKELYGNFSMPVHADIARDILMYRQWFPGVPMGLVKLDVARAFRRKMLGIASFGVLVFRLSGHTGVENAFNFGHTSAPSVYSTGTGRAIHEAHNASKVHISGEELRNANYAARV